MHSWTGETEGIVDFDAVHDGQVLVGRASTNGEATAKVLGRSNSGKRTQRSEDVVDAARDLEHVTGRHLVGQRLPGANHTFSNVHCLYENVPRISAISIGPVTPPIVTPI